MPFGDPEAVDGPGAGGNFHAGGSLWLRKIRMETPPAPVSLPIDALPEPIELTAGSQRASDALRRMREDERQ
jgi:hypothetical protein